jgi:hypothetical protein
LPRGRRRALAPPVSRVGGLVLIGYRMLTPGRVLLGCRSEHSALIDTGAQVCLFSHASQLVSLLRSAYSGPPLRGADNAPLESQSASKFTIQFDLSSMLPCLPQYASVVTAVSARA